MKTLAFAILCAFSLFVVSCDECETIEAFPADFDDNKVCFDWDNNCPDFEVIKVTVCN